MRIFAVDTMNTDEADLRPLRVIDYFDMRFSKACQPIMLEGTGDHAVGATRALLRVKNNYLLV